MGETSHVQVVPKATMSSNQRHLLTFCTLVAIVFVWLLFTLNTTTSRLTYSVHTTPVYSINCSSFPNDRPPPTSRPHKKHLLLVTHGRSGSTFTAGIISAHKDVFYFFEPVKNLDISNTDRVPLFRENLEREQTLQVVQSLQDCDFDNVSLVPPVFPTIMSGSFGNYTACLNEQQRPGFYYLKCFEKVHRDCLSSPVTFIKTIRFRMRWAKKMLLENPNSKVLFLLRDPRAVMMSQMHRLENPMKLNFTENLTYFCKYLGDDIEHAEILSNLFPGRVKVAHYEIGAMSPLLYTEALYKFIGLNMTDEVTQYVKSITNASHDEIGFGLGIVRKNSTEAVYSWRHTNSYKHAKLVDKMCGGLYGKLGYKMVSTKEELLSDTSLLVEPENPSMFVTTP